jgi:hypothetical protein
VTKKSLDVLHDQFLKAANHAILFGCSLSVEQFAASLALDPDELDELRAHLDAKGVAV